MESEVNVMNHARGYRQVRLRLVGMSLGRKDEITVKNILTMVGAKGKNET